MGYRSADNIDSTANGQHGMAPPVLIRQPWCIRCGRYPRRASSNCTGIRFPRCMAGVTTPDLGRARCICPGRPKDIVRSPRRWRSPSQRWYEGIFRPSGVQGPRRLPPLIEPWHVRGGFFADLRKAGVKNFAGEVGPWAPSREWQKTARADWWIGRANTAFQSTIHTGGPSIPESRT